MRHLHDRLDLWKTFRHYYRKHHRKPRCHGHCGVGDNDSLHIARSYRSKYWPHKRSTVYALPCAEQPHSGRGRRTVAVFCALAALFRRASFLFEGVVSLFPPGPGAVIPIERASSRGLPSLALTPPAVFLIPLRCQRYLPALIFLLNVALALMCVPSMNTAAETAAPAAPASSNNHEYSSIVSSVERSGKL